MTEFLEKDHFSDAKGIRKTEKALLCEIEGEEYWVPFSQIDDDSDVFEPGHFGMLITSHWWAKKEGLAE